MIRGGTHPNTLSLKLFRLYSFIFIDYISILSRVRCMRCIRGIDVRGGVSRKWKLYGLFSALMRLNLNKDKYNFILTINEIQYRLGE